MQEIARKTRLSVPLPQLAALFEEFGFTVENVVAKAKELL